MTDWQWIFSAISAIALFLYGLSGFSRELLDAGGQRLQDFLQKATANRFAGAALGALFTALIQSSSAVTSLAIALVNSGVLGFGASLAVLLGANVGTTATALLVSLKLTALGPIALSLGALTSALAPVRWKPLGKVLFYFGFVLFALDLIGAALLPLRESPAIVGLLSQAGTPWIGVLAGIGITALLQSSSVTTGLAVVLVQQQVLATEAAIYLVVGANIGTTVTGLIASASMGTLARKTALINAGFKVVGAALFAPMLVVFAQTVARLSPTPEMAVAWAHLIFNLVSSVLFLVFLPLYVGPLERWARPGPPVRSL
ncbi:Na/Pi symporter [Acidovorax sp.]|uniref:Na/Pi cotransporter family protein n=1 Tax=Acidovorax sp. TaxID=1872122 RepID=UPI002ACED75D|nr:Na/Pi symporter [Acidovorax sp.]MDZ7867132.1 Na/Pi symporter [Acidovorax sp.]